MKGVFGILLIGGGVILMVGLFTGKITFPLGASSSASSSSSVGSTSAPGKHGQVGTAGIPPITKQPGPCPPGKKC